MLHVISVEKNSLAKAIGVQYVEKRFALNVIRGGSEGCIRCGGPIEDLTYALFALSFCSCLASQKDANRRIINVDGAASRALRHKTGGGLTTACNNVFVVYDCTVMRLRERRERQGKLMLSGESDLLKEQLERSKCGVIIGSENVFSRRNQLGSATRKAVARANEWLVRSD